MMLTYGYGHKDYKNLETLKKLGNPDANHTNTYLVNKRKTSGEFSKQYVAIYLNPGENIDVAYRSSVVSEFLRLISLDVFPKVRVIIAESDQGFETLGMMSAYIEGFTNAEKFIGDDYEFNSQEIEQLAAIFVACLFAAENDFRYANWGRSTDGKIVKIDNDQAFFDYVALKDNRDGLNNSDEHLSKWPQEIYQHSTAFPITTKDIKNLPFLAYTRPTHWPTGYKKWTPLFKKLSTNTEFIKYKYKYFTKILIISDVQVDDIIRAHVPDKTTAKELKKYILDRKNQLAETLFVMRGHREYLDSLTDKDIFEFVAELKKYNDQYLVSSDFCQQSIYKPKYQRRLFDLTAVQQMLSEKCPPPSDRLVLKTKLDEMTSARNRELFALRNLLIRSEYKDLCPKELYFSVEAIERLRESIIAVSSIIVRPIITTLFNRYFYLNRVITRKQRQLQLLQSKEQDDALNPPLPTVPVQIINTTLEELEFATSEDSLPKTSSKKFQWLYDLKRTVTEVPAQIVREARLFLMG